MAHDTIATILETDLANSRMNQSDLATRLSELGPTTITESAITNWKARNSIPMKRLKQLADIFGPNSKCAQLFAYKYPAASLATIVDKRTTFDMLSVTPGAQEQPRGETTPRTSKSTFLVKEEIVRNLKYRLAPDLNDCLSQTAYLAGTKRTFDFLSSGVVVEVIAARSPTLQLDLLARKAIKLGALREVTRETYPDRRYVVILIRLPRTRTPEEPKVQQRLSAQLQTLISDCNMMGIWVSTLEGADDVANTIWSFEMQARSKVLDDFHHLDDEEP